MSVYFDHNASSLPHPEVLDAMMPYLHDGAANASSLHSAGRSLIEPLIELERLGQKVIRLKTNNYGQVDLSDAQVTFQTESPKLLSVMLANSETGVLQPVHQLTGMVNRDNCLMHSDATQEKYRRAGTENVAMIVGPGKAAQIAALEIEHKRYYLEQLRTVFETRLLAIPGVVIFGRGADRLPDTTYFSMPYYHDETLLMELDKAGLALASGSACHSAATRASHVLEAMGVDEQLALNAVRLSLAMSNTLH